MRWAQNFRIEAIQNQANQCQGLCSAVTIRKMKGPPHFQNPCLSVFVIIFGLALLDAASSGIRRSAMRPQEKQHAATCEPISEPNERLPLPESLTHSGYVDVNQTLGSSMFYMYYEALEPISEDAPIVLWLQGGPGCSSLFGMLYINGPYWINEDDLTLRVNPGSWGRLYGLLFIEQPIATGFSKAGRQRIPRNEIEIAEDLYLAINNWYTMYPSYQNRPLIVTGESYAGKYVPSFSHYILQADAQAHGYLHKVDHRRELGPNVEPPRFKLGGLAIGNGWTDADSQQLVQGDVAWAMGLIDLTTKRQVEILNDLVFEQLKSKNWHAARNISDQVNELIANYSSTYTLEDVRRNLGYDGYNIVDDYLNQKHVKKHIGADMDMFWVSCSEEVDAIMGQDVMKSVRNLVIDLLDFYPVLLYQGQWDAECGVASNDAWIQSMKWTGHYDFNHSPREHWLVNGRVMGYWRQHAQLTQLVVRNTGHMVPHDNPYYGQLLLERWIEERMYNRKYNRSYSEEDECMYNRIRGHDEGASAGPPRKATRMA